MKKIIAFALLILVCLGCFLTVYGEEIETEDAVIGDQNGNTDNAVSDIEESGTPDTDETENTDELREFEEIMTELYLYWRDYTETEGDNGFEKAVNFAWKYRGDIGGVAAAIAVCVFILIMAFRYMPKMSKYFNYIYQENAETRNAIMSGVTSEIEKYAPALETVAQVAEMYPKLREYFEKLSRENAALTERIDNVGKRVEETERAHAAELKLQGETFRDIITLSALPVGKKTEIMEKYRLIQSEVSGQNGSESLDGEGAKV